ncbi:hypothetical protein DTO271G3_5148 [Paecilomyces variotii]|nr:hypothetical protein DTO271G3_5148 [Paecilomyces variotii]
MARSGIIYQNTAKTIFLVDIPTSIAVAQDIRIPDIKREEADRQRHILSARPLKTPYPSPPEPKTETARKRVLERIPSEEHALHNDVFGPLAKDAMRELNQSDTVWGLWCLPRCLVDEDEDGCRKAKRRLLNELELSTCDLYTTNTTQSPPLILSPGDNDFQSLSELQNILVKNTSTASARVNVKGFPDFGNRDEIKTQKSENITFTIPPESAFVLSTLSMESSPSVSSARQEPIPEIPPGQKFNLILLDPPWPNRSVRRSSHYATHSYSDMDTLTRYIEAILRNYLHDEPGGQQQEQKLDRQTSIAAIWVTNTAKSRNAAYDAMLGAGLSITEEWIWVKTTVDGKPVSPIDGLWRKPYEVLVIGRRYYPREKEGRDGLIQRRVIVAVPDIHSRKPNLKELFERIFFSDACAQEDGEDREEMGGCSSRVGHSVLEVFARNLTAGWWACGNEVLKFNQEKWWFG